MTTPLASRRAASIRREVVCALVWVHAVRQPVASTTRILGISRNHSSGYELADCESRTLACPRRSAIHDRTIRSEHSRHSAYRGELNARRWAAQHPPVEGITA